jgi:hypothetical protein
VSPILRELERFDPPLVGNDVDEGLGMKFWWPPTQRATSSTPRAEPAPQPRQQAQEALRGRWAAADPRCLRWGRGYSLRCDRSRLLCPIGCGSSGPSSQEKAISAALRSLQTEVERGHLCRKLERELGRKLDGRGGVDLIYAAPPKGVSVAAWRAAAQKDRGLQRAVACPSGRSGESKLRVFHVEGALKTQTLSHLEAIRRGQRGDKYLERFP